MADPYRYPVSLVVEGRPCLVVGGGRIATRKIEGLLACGALVTVIAPHIDVTVRRLPGVQVQERPYASGDVAGFRLVITATDDAAVNAAVFADAEAAGIWANSADDPDNCSFTLPSVARRGPLTVAVSTAGTSPALAAWLRRRIEADLGPEYEVVLELLAAERARLRAEGGTSEVAGWTEALNAGLVDLVREGHIDGARRLLRDALGDGRHPDPDAAAADDPAGIDAAAAGSLLAESRPR